MGAYRDGYRQTRTRGDAWQQGGVFVIETGGEMVYAYPSEHTLLQSNRQDIASHTPL